MWVFYFPLFSNKIISYLCKNLDKMGEENAYETTINMKDSYVNVCEIELPERFNTVVLKLCPEIREVVTIGYKSNTVYNPRNFEPTFNFLVAINLFFNENDVPKGGKDHYEGLFNNYFKMTYGSEMDFISFKVESLIVPPEKTNQDKFFELFKKKVDEKNS